ncbi:DinB family protein [Dawidia soli]|uniref:Damage-inducible protein DinB n=1 Tax=Dawidia soli TaxID=2782352 RepID=A0AAP2DBT7_9BACT|nr:DinB family protein [Dawidia soli]MBT1689133.1 damage-inducible protein DinB [Dawidia soli]
MKDFFNELFHYNHSSNQKLWDAFQANAGKTSEKALALFSHIVNAHQIWNNRIDKKLTAFGVWDVHTLEACQDIDRANYEHTKQILDILDPNIIVNFTMRGKACSKKASDLLFHVINHSTYHRAQIATDFRQSGIEPLNTDFILYEQR